MSETLNSFLARHCTQSDDHDFENCRKCAEMKEEIEVLIEAARVDAANEMRERCAGVGRVAGRCTSPSCGEILYEIIKGQPLPDRSEAFLREKIEQAIEAGAAWKKSCIGDEMQPIPDRPTYESILSKASKER